MMDLKKFKYNKLIVIPKELKGESKEYKKCKHHKLQKLVNRREFVWFSSIERPKKYPCDVKTILSHMSKK